MAAEKVNTEKKLEALMKRADEEAIKQDKTLEEEIVQDRQHNSKEEIFEGSQLVEVAATVTSQGVPDTVAFIALSEELELELKRVECECLSRLDELDRGLNVLKCKVKRSETGM